MERNKKRKVMSEIVWQWRESGLSQREYALKNNIPFSRLKYWINKYRLKADFTEAESSFIQLGGISGTSGICLRYPNGVELTLPDQTPVAIIKSLINI